MTCALVTGSSSGLGREIALRLAREGIDALVHGRSQEGIDATCRLVAEAGAGAEGCRADLADRTAVDALARQAAARPDLAVVVHNAGGYGPAPVSEESLDLWDEILDVQLRAIMRITAITLPRVRDNAGAFIFIGSVDALSGSARRCASTAASAGRIGFAASLFEEVRESGVRVVTIHPGYMNTPLAVSDRLDPERMVQPSDVAELVVTAIRLPPNSCVVQMTVRPQRSPYRPSA